MLLLKEQHDVAAKLNAPLIFVYRLQKYGLCTKAEVCV